MKKFTVIIFIFLIYCNSSFSDGHKTKFKDIKGSTTQTIINHIDVIIHNLGDNNINLFVRRSFSNHLWDWLNDGANLL